MTDNKQLAPSLPTVDRATPRVTVLVTDRGKLYFWEHNLAAVDAGNYVYILDSVTIPGLTRYMNEKFGSAVTVRIAPAEFRFVVGNILTTSGIPLTRLTQADS